MLNKSAIKLYYTLFRSLVFLQKSACFYRNCEPACRLGRKRSNLLTKNRLLRPIANTLHCKIGLGFAMVLTFIFISNNTIAQSSLLFPIKPGHTNTLAGTMGELRSSHFHTGIDIRTGGQEGLAVLAADDGYIFRVSVNPRGYGNAVYIKHPNGHTTVYAHLKSFRKDIANYMRSEQYLKQKFKLNAYPTANKFKVSRGDTIALSGNSGSSGGPHLHFDVRNRNQDLLNPLHYGFAEVTDIRPPLAKDLALVTSTINSQVNGEFGRIEIPFEYIKNNYFIRDTINALGRIGLELYAYDRMNNTRFKTGINKIEIKVNNSIKMVTTIETWPFSKSRQFYTYLNYEALANNRKRFHKLYIDDGNHLDFYSNTTDNGYLTIEKDKIYNVDIKLTDSYENESTVHFILKGSSTTINNYKNTAIPKNNWKINKSILIIKTELLDTLLLYKQGKSISIEPSFSNEQNRNYLWNLTDGIIDSISINGTTQALAIKALIPAGVAYKLYNPIADIQFAKSTLFTNLFFTLSSAKDNTTGVEIISIGNPNVPLNKNYAVQFKPLNVPADKSKWRIYAVWGKNASYVGGTWKGNQISFKSRSFGNYTLMADSTPPTIKPLIINNNELVFKITDDLSGISRIKMLVNNQWVLMHYDPKNNLIWAEKPTNNFKYKGKLELVVTDNAGNKKVHSTNIN